ncbi:phage protein NinX family protein [Saccharomonospora sp. CUA-673]|uniref:phage protein NinX family protein n=1 Tax=Saccharomonospora sp. CUA-673 TaxID=1904969 RepID=UPI001115118D
MSEQHQVAFPNSHGASRRHKVAAHVKWDENPSTAWKQGGHVMSSREVLSEMRIRCVTL